MTVLAHIGAIPFEEWLVPLLASGGGIVVGLRAAFRRSPKRVPRSSEHRSA